MAWDEAHLASMKSIEFLLANCSPSDLLTSLVVWGEGGGGGGGGRGGGRGVGGGEGGREGGRVGGGGREGGREGACFCAFM